jgi:NhaP-type Na+/H+ or K+/H+ antiporter
MSPRLILFIFLPALIFEGSLSTDFYVFRKQLFSGLLLAFPGMMVQIALIAVFAVYWFPFGWGWVESLLFGGILSATDPVAVIALMKELGRLPGGWAPLRLPPSLSLSP